MNAHTLSASGVHLALLCSAPFRADAAVTRDKPGPAAERGRRVHAAIERYLLDGTYTVNEVHPDDDAYFSSWLGWWDAWPASRQTWRPEIPYLLNAELGTSRELGPLPGPREYGAVGASEIPMTLDAVAVAGGLVLVVDWKTGALIHDHGAQLRTNALAAALAHGATEARALAVYLSPDGAFEGERIVMDAFALDDHAAALRDLMRRLPTADAVAGEHCTREWCRLRNVCRTRRALLKEQRETERGKP